MDNMHRVDTKRRRTKVLRFVAYGLTISLTVFTTVLLLYISLGYRLDSKNGHLIRSGLLLVDTKPEAAQIFINNELKDNSAPGRFVLSAGNYNLVLKQTGYRDWAKSVAIKASGVKEVQYPLLIPTKLTSQNLEQMEAPTLVSQSQDRKLLLTYLPGAQRFRLIELSTDTLNQTDIPVPTAVRLKDGQVGSFKVIEWALNNRFVLLQHTLPGGEVELLSLDVGKPDEMVNITTLYGAAAPSNVHYVGGNTAEIYGLKDGVLSKYKLKSAASEALMQNVRSYEPYSDDTVLFDRLGLGDKSEVGIYQNQVTTVLLSQSAPTAPAHLQYANYDEHDYFVVARPNETVTVIYRDPLKKPVLSKQLPFRTLKFENPSKIGFSPSGQFLLVQNGNDFITYDFNEFTQYQVTLPYELEPDSIVSWLDSAHLLVSSQDTSSYILDYDGLNSQKLGAIRAGTTFYWAPNSQYAYHLSNEGDGVALQTTSLLAN